MAGTVTQELYALSDGSALVRFTCLGDHADGSIPDTDFSSHIIKYITGLYLQDVIAFPTPGGVAPDAADVAIKTDYYPTRSATITPAVPRDLLGGNGANLIHATNEQHVGTSMPTYEKVSGGLTLTVANQATIDAEYTVIAKFVSREDI